MLNISGIQEGFVLDHIKAGMSLQLYHDLHLDKLDCTVAIIKNARSEKMGKKDIVTPTLDVYFEDGPQRFLFTWEKNVKEWIAAISAVVKGEPFEPKGEFDDMMQDMAKMAAFAERISDSVVGSVTRVKDALGIKSREKVALKCPSCGASLAGIRGETDKCPYCGTCVKF